ncbi:MAG: DNA polymerase I [Sulfuricaulis sp.]|uniref:DNA polymerase I n=1 Tax=Sulfuricaulis sp. TaxID=2003553 RepID=UPI0025DC2742|nr:DNA polymerase I [Sulfuricaulis sp.]MCR4347856.1 DNA polymerase I [Sulfuricaulis sp.]
MSPKAGTKKKPARKASAGGKKAGPLVLVDGSSYLYRAFHAMPALANSRGEPTGAVYGVTNMLRRLLADYDTEYMAVVFDARGKTFRDDIYPEYKANRPPMPDDLSNQIEPIHAIVRALGLPLIQFEGVEADDVIGTLARAAAAEGRDAVISTGDKDMAQLVDGHVQLVDTMKNAVIDREAVVAKFGVTPEQIVDFLTLVGDTSDNIPGVPSVGPKTAAKWLQEYGSLEQIVAHANEIDGRVGESLRGAIGHLPMSHQLATIKCDVDLKLQPGDLKRTPPDTARLRELFAHLEFKSWLAELGGANAPTAAPTPATVNANYQMITDMKVLEVWLTRLEKAKLFAFDTETTSLDALQAEIVGVSFTDRAGDGAYVPLAHHYPGAPEQLSREAVLEKLKPLLEDEGRLKVGQNLKYDMSVLANYDIQLAGMRYDTMLESYVLDSTASRHDMDSLALKYLGYKTVKYEEVAGKGKHQINFSEVPLDTATAYAAEDADITLRLHEHLWPRLSETPTLVKLFDEIEMPLVPVLARMERHGVLIDVAMLRSQGNELGKRVLEIEGEAHKLAGQPFNIGSPKQIQEILYDKHKLPVLKKTPTGQPSTAEEVLQELALDYPLPQLILDFRSFSKLKSTYTDKLPEMIDPKTGRVHTSYHQAVAATGRLSSTDPNLQNIPVRTAEGRRIRQAFIAAPGYKIMSADYSQIELRIMAHLSGDKGLIQAFAENRDVHRATAAEVFGVAPDGVSDDMRRAAKAINFGLIYGMSAFGLAKQLHIERVAAQEYVERYFTRYPGVRDFMERTRVTARRQGYVETLFGRRLHTSEINAANMNRRQAAERAAINAPMQGTAADLIKRAMIVVDRWIPLSGLDIRMIMQVHDELVFEVAEDAVDTAREHVRQAMSGVAKLAVPLVVDIGVGGNWDEAH